MRRGIIFAISLFPACSNEEGERGGGIKGCPFPSAAFGRGFAPPEEGAVRGERGKGGWWRSETDTQRRAAKGIGDRQAHAFFAKERTKIEKWLRTWVRGYAKTRSGEYDKFLFFLYIQIRWHSTPVPPGSHPPICGWRRGGLQVRRWGGGGKAGELAIFQPDRRIPHSIASIARAPSAARSACSTLSPAWARG